MVNVLYVMPEFKLAGAETMCTALSTALSAKYHITVASLYDTNSSLIERMSECGIRVVFLHKHKGLDLSIIIKLFKLMKSAHIQVVHTHLYVMQYAIPAACLSHVKVRIHTIHNIATKEVGFVQRRLSSLFYKYFRVVPVAISPIVKKTIIEEYGLSCENVPMIYNGADIKKCLVKTDYSFHGTIKILHVGRLTSVKNQDLLIDVIKRLCDNGFNVSLDLYGEGGKKNEYQEKILTLNLQGKVNLKGLTDDVYPVMHRADIFVLPSIYEGMPMTLIEAMGTGLPIIASKVGGIPDMIENGKEGLLINPSFDELYKCIEKLIRDEGLRRHLGVNARRKSIDFSTEVMAKNYSDLYERRLKDIGYDV
jgi:glycosyltransferase involved in cell wall biosynthesis